MEGKARVSSKGSKDIVEIIRQHNAGPQELLNPLLVNQAGVTETMLPCRGVKL